MGRYFGILLAVLLWPLVVLAQPTATDAVSWSGAVELPGGMKLEFSVALRTDEGTITIPAQGVKDLPLSDVKTSASELRFSIKAAGAVWEMKVSDDGQTATGVLKQGGEFKTTLRRLAPGESASKTLKRPQEPVPPLPYVAEDVTFESKPGVVTLSGTLTKPKGDGPFACVVLVSGSGPQDRDENLLGHKPFLVLADHLTRQGIAVLRYDDRGVAKSTGDFSSATSDDFADDAESAVEFLRTRRDVDPNKIGIVGHSEGGLIAPIVAARSKHVAFIVLLAGTGMSGAELLPIQGKLISIAAGVDAATAESQAAESAKILRMVVAGSTRDEVRSAIHAAATRQLKAAPDTKSLGDDEIDAKANEIATSQVRELFGPWFKRFLVMDPRENLKKVTCPVLAICGELDLQVPPKDNLPLIEKALKEAGNTDITIQELPGLNHLFQTTKTGSPSEYSQIEETFAPAALETVSRWIRSRVGIGDKPSAPAR